MTNESYCNSLRIVFELLQANQLYESPENYEFFKEKIYFHGLVFVKHGIRVDPE